MTKAHDIENEVSTKKLKMLKCFPLPDPVLQVWVGRWEFFLTSQIGYPLNLIVYSKIWPLKKKTKNVCFFKTDYCIMQVKCIAKCSQEAFCNTFDLHLAPICH